MMRILPSLSKRNSVEAFEKLEPLTMTPEELREPYFSSLSCSNKST